MTRIKQWFACLDHFNFPLITAGKIREDVISFSNGYIDLNELGDCRGFHRWEDVDDAPLTDHFFERDFTFEAQETPLWDQILELQLADTRPLDQRRGRLSMIECLEVLIGRLFYPIGAHDNWQVAVLLKGDANTGKSTIVDLVRHMLPEEAVGVITATHEGTFGLEGLYKKRVILIPDVPEDFKRLINQSDFQSMVTGEGVSVARKFATAVVNKRWTAPLLGAGNVNFNYKDASGSISRRVVTFPFLNLVEARNTQLVHMIVRDELVSVLIRCLLRYRAAAKEHKGRDFWQCVAAESLKDTQVEQADSNPLGAFLRHGDDFYQIIFKEGSVTPMTMLNKAFSNHMKFTHQIDKARIGSDHYPIKAAGYLIQKKTLCKSCHGAHSPANCGGHFDIKNSYRPETIVNLQILKIGRPD